MRGRLASEALLATAWITAAVAPLQDEQLAAGAPLDVRVEGLELDGRGPSVTLTYRAESAGTIQLWASSDEIDPFLRIESESAELLSEDDNSGGGNVPFLRRDVAAGTLLYVTVASARPAESGAAMVRLELLPAANEEDRATLDAARDALDAAMLYAQSDSLEQARAAAAEGIDSLSELCSRPDRLPPSGALSALSNAARQVLPLQDPELDLRAQETLVTAYERTSPPEHTTLLGATMNLANVLLKLRRYEQARELQERAVAAFARSLPEEHSTLLRARLFLASTLAELGEVDEAHTIEADVVASFEKSLPPGHATLLMARSNHAVTKKLRGDFEGAATLEEAVLGALLARPDTDPQRLGVQQNLGLTRLSQGDIGGGRALLESALEVRERVLPAGHPDLVRARLNAAMARRMCGDLDGARALEEEGLALFRETYGPDHPDVLRARQNLAATLFRAGDIVAAEELFEEVLVARQRLLPSGHPDRFRARANLGAVRAARGDAAGARALLADALDEGPGGERGLADTHPAVAAARLTLAGALDALGERDAADRERALAAEAIADLPLDNPTVVAAREQEVDARASRGERVAALAALPALIDSVHARVSSALVRAPREARAIVASEAGRLALALEVGSGRDVPADVRGRLFELVETHRVVATAAEGIAANAARDPNLAPLYLQSAELRARLNDLVTSGPGALGSDAGHFGAQVRSLALERDAVEARLRRALADRGRYAERLDSPTLAAALPDKSAAVGFWRHARKVGPDRFIAHVLRADGSLAQVDLGGADELVAHVDAWRSALGAPLDRGVSVPDSPDTERSTGSALRERVLDPILKTAGPEIETLFVCPDDALHLVPLDALPTGNEERVGDALAVRREISFARLVAPRPPVSGEPSLLALGFVDYDAEARTDAEPPEAPASRGSVRRWRGLLQTRYEVEALALQFESVFGHEARVLQRTAASKAALRELAPGTRFLHVATHGWFAPESVPELTPVAGAGPSPLDARESVEGFAPLTLCGLALAGANEGRDELGRVPGILTAEELCGIDLSECSLAVLSACETSVGTTRAGQGVRSLQAALHTAGARATLTSLWRVDDAATRRLMERFYDALWSEGRAAAAALWESKQALRDEGHPARDWAGWVLSGESR